ncbi:hypothetical protein GDO86_012551 [Hymenochirus boettgeri]|uniref:Transcription factor HES-5 n=1 Tax=Hymenochirus boettgeri TaxID=247094 RepID=A0A8T2IRK7_9PIPI|nr:hypothetical protein GDO86_012551 [Hymenochirus boettgeri]
MFCIRMAPCNRVQDLENKAGRESRKLRKPVIEKMRRDRINSSIEQLRMLLEKEFENHHLPSKPEKADILEMAVNLLRQQIQIATKTVLSGKQVFSSLMDDPVRFSTLNKHTVAEMNLLMNTQERRTTGEHTCQTVAPSFKQPSLGYSTMDLWRPW